MTLPRLQRIVLALLVAVPTAMNAVALFPEAANPVPNVNDGVEHVAFVRRAADAWARGENPIDFWLPEIELGVPQFLEYQHLAHISVAALGRLSVGAFDLRSVFDLVRYALLLAFPLTVFWSMRTMGFAPTASAIGAGASSLVSGDHRYGFEYDSYVWRGFGLFTQLFAMHLSFIAIALLHRVANRGTGIVAAALACTALALSHLLYAYMLAITAVVLLVFGITRANAARRVLRFALVGAVTAAATSYMWLPFFMQAAYVYATPYLDPAKYTSYGAGPILSWLFTGDLFDHGRVPVLTLLLAGGVISAVATRSRVALLALSLFAVWLVLYFGRPTLGGLVDLFPLHEGLLLHRFIGGVDIFAIVLMGFGGARVWDLLRATASSRRLVVVAGATLLLLAPALSERWSYYAQGADWMRQTQAALDRDADARTIINALQQQPPGRVYAGLRSNWGQTLDFGIPFNSVRFYNLLAHYDFDAVGPPIESLSLNADLLWEFNDQDLSHYRLFNVDYVIAPPTVTLPSALRPLVTTTKYVLYGAPGRGYAEYAAIANGEAALGKADLVARELAWFRNAGAARWAFNRYAYAGSGPIGVPLPIADCAPGQVAYERVQPARFDILARCDTASAMVVKVTYHPNWHVTVDGTDVPTFMASPSYLAFALPAGEHFIVAEYRSTPIKAPLLLLGGIVLTVAVLARLRPPLQAQWPHWRARPD
ncbi:MAG: hypothetical protein ABJB39_06155 [Chloroflexota bacterium]